MNTKIRREIEKITDELAALASRIENIKAREGTSRDLLVSGSFNSLYDRERYEESLAAIAAMDNALTSIGEANDQLEEAQR